MQIHLILDPRLGPARWTELGRLAEASGIGGLWTSNLLGSYDPFVAFAPVAHATDRIRMGPIAINPFDIHPTRIAAALLTLNEISHGRAQIVVGGGGEALEALNLKPERRVTAVRECVALIRQAATGVKGDFDGQVFQAKGFGCEWASQPPPPIWIGANGPQMIAMAAKVADGIMMSDLPQPELGKAILAAKAVRAEAGNAAPVSFSNFVAWHVYDDIEKARAEARRWLAWRGLNRRWICTHFISDAEFDLIEANMPALYQMAFGGPRPDAVPRSLMDTLADKLTLTGQVDALEPIIAHLEELRDAGLTHVAIRLYQDIEQSIALIGKHIVPHFH